MPDLEGRIRKLEIQMQYLSDVNRSLLAVYADQCRAIFEGMKEADRIAEAEGIENPLYFPRSQR